MPTQRATTDRGVLTAAPTADASRPFTATDWGHVQWRQGARDVRRLQHRIFMAKVRGDARGLLHFGRSASRLVTEGWEACPSSEGIPREGDGSGSEDRRGWWSPWTAL